LLDQFLLFRLSQGLFDPLRRRAAVRTSCCSSLLCRCCGSESLVEGSKQFQQAYRELLSTEVTQNLDSSYGKQSFRSREKYQARGSSHRLSIERDVW
jgi:hypothetical protein